MGLKLKFAAFFLTFGLSSTLAQAQEKPLSSAESVTGKINGTNITIDYGSPSVRGREIWGKLVPLDEVWRAGANNATTFTTDKDIMVEGMKLPAGKYGFFVIPNAKESTIIFNKIPNQWGAYKYEESKDQLRVKVKPEVSATSKEKLEYTINKDNVTLSWEKWNIPIKIK
jgi:DUF2911 family protein